MDRNVGDVIFLARDENNSVHKLYAYKSVLSTASEYFKSRIDRTDDSTNSKGLDPEWRATGPTTTSMESTISDNRQVIDMTDPENDIDFTTLHNIFYFLYTGTVNLHVALHNEAEEYNFPEGYPQPPDPFCLYRNSDKFLLGNLKERCHAHLKHGVTRENIAERLFHKDTRHYEELRALYLNYLIVNYDDVKTTEGWKRAVLNEDENFDPDVIRYRSRLLYEISQSVIKKA